MTAAPTRLAAAASFAALAVLALTTEASGQAITSTAQPRPNAPDWAFGSPIGEAALGATCFVSLLSYFIPQRVSDWGPYSSVERDDVYGRISDFTGAGAGAVLQLGAGYVMEGAYYTENSIEKPFVKSMRSSLVDAEALILTSGVTFALKRLTGRCRPRAWREGKCGPKDAENDAFPSGHTSPVGAVAGSRFVLAFRSTGQTSTRWAAFSIAEGATVITGLLRVLAGAHSWEDVVGGWAIGHATGAVVAFAHPMVEVAPRAPAGSPQAEPTTASWSWRF